MESYVIKISVCVGVCARLCVYACKCVRAFSFDCVVEGSSRECSGNFVRTLFLDWNEYISPFKMLQMLSLT